MLDKLLVDAAVESGAELREQFTVEDLIRDGDRVVGIQGRGRNGGSVKEKAKVVIGADGVNSFVAKAVGAEEYDTIPPLATFYYSYYSGFQADDLEQHIRPHDGCACFPTHHGLTLIAGVWSSKRFNEIRADIEGSLKKTLQTVPSVMDRLSRAKREEKWVGTAGVANYFRKPFGPGWALVGDAGYQKDPITAQGMSDAFIDAENVAQAVDDGFSGRRPLDQAFAAYQSSRDQRVKPMYHLTSQLAAMEPPPPQMQQLFGALHGNQEATNEFYSAITGSTPLPEFMNPENLGRIMAGAAGRAS